MEGAPSACQWVSTRMLEGSSSAATGKLNDLRNFVGAGPELFVVALLLPEGPRENPHPELRPRRHLVHFPENRNVFPLDAHLLFGFPERGVQWVSVFRVGGPSGEGNLPLVVLNLLRALVQQHAELAVLCVQQHHNGSGRQTIPGHPSGGPVCQRPLDQFRRCQDCLHSRDRRLPVYSNMEEVTSSRLRCSSGSSVSVHTMATWQARRAGIPSDISRPA